jgi:hypothetical protein
MMTFVLPPFKELRIFSFTTPAAAATVTKNNHDYSSGKHTYMRQK